MKWLMGALGIGVLGEVTGAAYLFQRTIKSKKIGFPI